MRALVVTASKHGATAEIGSLIADVLNARGIATDVRPAEGVTSLDGVDAVILGSAVYMGRWLESARRLAERMPAAFRAREVWLFSSGPLGDPLMPSVEADDAQKISVLLAARDHRTFAGRLRRRELRSGERAITRMVGVPEGDFIPRGDVRAWAGDIADALLTPADA